ncbi:MAG: TMEM175 family protein [Methanobacteriaceae archaeon]
MSFILLGTFWLNHHVFFLIKESNSRLVWINIVWLMLIGIVPFSAALVSGYSGYFLSELFFGINIFLIGILNFGNLYYAYKSDFLDEKIENGGIPLVRSTLILH